MFHDIFGKSDGLRLTIRDLCYTAFMKAKNPSDEDGGPSDWFNDTLPLIEKGIEQLKELNHGVVFEDLIDDSTVKAMRATLSERFQSHYPISDETFKQMIKAAIAPIGSLMVKRLALELQERDDDSRTVGGVREDQIQP